jgi:hypothetical protein
MLRVTALEPVVKLTALYAATSNEDQLIVPDDEY